MIPTKSEKLPAVSKKQRKKKQTESIQPTLYSQTSYVSVTPQNDTVTKTSTDHTKSLSKRTMFHLTKDSLFGFTFSSSTSIFKRKITRDNIIILWLINFYSIFKEFRDIDSITEL